LYVLHLVLLNGSKKFRPVLRCKRGAMSAASGPTFFRGPQFVGSGKIFYMQREKSNRNATTEVKHLITKNPLQCLSVILQSKSAFLVSRRI